MNLSQVSPLQNSSGLYSSENADVIKELSNRYMRNVRCLDPKIHMHFHASAIEYAGDGLRKKLSMKEIKVMLDQNIKLYNRVNSVLEFSVPEKKVELDQYQIEHLDWVKKIMNNDFGSFQEEIVCESLLESISQLGCACLLLNSNDLEIISELICVNVGHFVDFLELYDSLGIPKSKVKVIRKACEGLGFQSLTPAIFSYFVILERSKCPEVSIYDIFINALKDKKLTLFAICFLVNVQEMKDIKDKIQQSSHPEDMTTKADLETKKTAERLYKHKMSDNSSYKHRDDSVAFQGDASESGEESSESSESSSSESSESSGGSEASAFQDKIASCKRKKDVMLICDQNLR